MEPWLLDLERAKQSAKISGLPLPIAAMQLHTANIKNQMYWSDVNYLTQDEGESKYADIVQHGGWIGELARACAAEVLFPVNSIFLHALGVFGSAAGFNFKYQYYRKQKAVNLYCVVSQPPSSGKSSASDFFKDPFAAAFAERNDRNRPKFAKILNELKDLKAEAKDGRNVSVEIEQAEDELKAVSHIKFILDDVTPESAEIEASKQGGYANIISSEADALNVILGRTYGDGNGKSNHGVFLKLWDTEWHSSSRVKRDGYEGPLYGSIAVLAQDESIDAVLRVGQESGRGISERFLIIREKNLFGRRQSSMREQAKDALVRELEQTARNMVDEIPKVLTLTKSGLAMINELSDALDLKMADGMEFSSNMIRGAAGKADKQIHKIACIMHIAEDWRPTGRRRTIVDDKHVKNAILIFNELLKTYLYAADSLRISGIDTEIEFTAKKIEELAKKKIFKLQTGMLRNEIRNRGPLKGVSGLAEKIKEKYLPELQKRGYLVEYQGTIYINPKLG